MKLMQEKLKQLASDTNNVQLAYVTHDDVREISSFKNQTVIAIKAPQGTRLEVPDPDEVSFKLMFFFYIFIYILLC